MLKSGARGHDISSKTAVWIIAVSGLQLTAAFEGHGFSLAQGNWDGAGVTWGIIGFTLKHGALGKIILPMFECAADP